MKNEMRMIKASFLTGVSELLLGVFMSFTGWHDWYYNHFKFFGVLGIGMLFYAFWHWVFYKLEVKNVR